MAGESYGMEKLKLDDASYVDDDLDDATFLDGEKFDGNQDMCDDNNPLIKAVTYHDSHLLKQLLANPENNKYLNVKDSCPPLHLACHLEDLACVKLLLEHEEVEYSLLNYMGLTPIHIACVTGNMDILKCIVEEFEEYDEPTFEKLIDLRTNYGQSPLHAAVGGRNPKEMVPYLLDHGACAISVDYQDKYPSYYCRDDKLKELLEAKEDEHSKNLEAELKKKAER